MSLTSPELAGDATWEVPDLIRGHLGQDRARRKVFQAEGKSRHRLPKTPRQEDMKSLVGRGVMSGLGRRLGHEVEVGSSQ